MPSRLCESADLLRGGPCGLKRAYGLTGGLARASQKRAADHRRYHLSPSLDRRSTASRRVRRFCPAEAEGRPLIAQFSNSRQSYSRRGSHCLR
jgi:hypothetical protein